MAKIDKVISIKVEGVRRIKELEDSLKKLRKELSKVSQDRSNTLLTWAEIDDRKE